MVTPYIIMIIFWLSIILLVVGMIGATIQVLDDDSDNTMAVVGLCVAWPIGLPLGILVIRIYCELLILLFRINETLTDIKNQMGTKTLG